MAQAAVRYKIAQQHIIQPSIFASSGPCVVSGCSDARLPVETASPEESGSILRSGLAPAIFSACARLSLGLGALSSRHPRRYKTGRRWRRPSLGRPHGDPRRIGRPKLFGWFVGRLLPPSPSHLVVLRLISPCLLDVLFLCKSKTIKQKYRCGRSANAARDATRCSHFARVWSSRGKTHMASPLLSRKCGSELFSFFSCISLSFVSFSRQCPRADPSRVRENLRKREVTSSAAVITGHAVVADPCSCCQT